MPVTVCVDPGHGRPDPGAIGPSGLKEADVTLAVAKALAAELRRQGHHVVLTREGPDAPGPKPYCQAKDLRYRVSLANRVRAHAFVSIHCNSASSSQAHGTECWIYTKPAAATVQLATLIQDRLVQATGLANRGVRRANFYVLRHTTMPAVLVELAFISNPKEEALLATPAWQERCAAAIAAAVEAWLACREPAD